MTKIQGISDYPKQIFSIALPDGETLTLSLTYRPLQQGWFASVVYQNFEIDNLRVTCNYNILEQWSNLIPFGIACFTTQNQEPFFAQDFLAGNAALCLLDATDLENLEAFYASEV